MNIKLSLSTESSPYIASLYEAYFQDPDSVEFGWRKFFEEYDFGPQHLPKDIKKGNSSENMNVKELSVLELIKNYRTEDN